MSYSPLHTLGPALRMVPVLLRSGPAGSFTAADLLERQARRRPDTTFVRFEGRDVSYGALNAANRIAHWALANELGKGSVAALPLENRPEYIALWMGLAKAGVTSALLNTNLRGEALAHSVRTAGATLVMIGSECAEAWRSLGADAPAVDLFVLADPAGVAPALPPHADLRGADPLFYIYTSGTTGLPKAARFSHSRFMNSGALQATSDPILYRDDASRAYQRLDASIHELVVRNALRF